MPTPEEPITFVQYIMQTMFQPGENKQHLVETVIKNVWARGAHAHVFEVSFHDQTGTFEAAWLAMPEAEWDAFLRRQESELDETIESTIAALEAEANREVDDDGN